MICMIIALVVAQDELVRTPSIYRCPAIEAESKFFPTMLEEDEFDTYCIEPKPSARVAAMLKGKAKTIKASEIDTAANLKWRNATIDFVNGKISPKTWVSTVANLHETVHFLSSPKTKQLRAATGNVTRKAVCAEMLLLSWPGKPCLTADDIGATRYLPGPGELESWILAMRDFLGPKLYMRSEDTFLVTSKPLIVRADAKPGLLIFSQTNGRKTITFYFNNSSAEVELPDFNMDNVGGVTVGLDLEGKKPRLQSGGFMSTSEGDETIQ